MPTVGKIEYKVWGETQRPWGYEVRIDSWGADGQHYPICMTWADGGAVPSGSAIQVEAERRVQRLVEKLSEPPEEPEVTYGSAEIAAILQAKGYTVTRVEDLPPAGAKG